MWGTKHWYMCELWQYCKCLTLKTKCTCITKTKTKSVKKTLTMKLAVFLFCVNWLHQVYSVGYYYRKPGLLTSNSCAVNPCPTCPTGQYMQGCAGFSSAIINGPAPGSCTLCTAVANSLFTSDGGITDSCPFACNEGYFDSGGHCSPKSSDL